MPRIHSTATVDPDATLTNDVEVGPYCLVEQGVTIGPGCHLRNHVTIRRHTTLGRDNVLDAGCVLGGEPQDLKFDPACVSFLRVGDHNVFREGVTISRASKPGGATVVGSNTYWMVGSHAGHDTTIGDNVILVNGAAVGGHAVISPRVFLSAHVVVHQFCWVGDMVMTEGNAAMRSHVPPYVMVVGRNCVMGLNVVGLRRAADLTDEDRRQIKEAYSITYRSDLSPASALEKMDQCDDWRPAAARFRDFVRNIHTAVKPFDRGLCPARLRAGSA